MLHQLLTLEPIPWFIFHFVSVNGSRLYLRSTQLARSCGVSTDTLRHYERKGVLHAARSANGYREYPLRSEHQVRLVRHALSVGFTLDELARIVKIRDAGGAPCKEVRALASAKLRALQEQISALEALRDELRGLLRTWDAKLAGTEQGQQARLLDMLGPSTVGTSAGSGAKTGKAAAPRGRSKMSTIQP